MPEIFLKNKVLCSFVHGLLKQHHATWEAEWTLEITQTFHSHNTRKKIKASVIPSVGEDCVENRFSALFLGILTDPITLRTIWQHLVRLKIGTVSGPIILFLKTKLHVGAKRHTKMLTETLLRNRNKPEPAQISTCTRMGK